MNHYLYTDGGSRGNPGKAASGWLIFDHDHKLVAFDATYVGTTTNNQAEYHALVNGLKLAHKHGIKSLEVRMDSELIIKQLKGEYRIKDANMQLLKSRVDEQLINFTQVLFKHIPREQNTYADKLVNLVLDYVN